VTTTAPTRRERLRAATEHDIRAAARRLLVAGGPAAISLRAIGRDLGMSAPALYRYFTSLEALIADLVGGLYEELAAAILADTRHGPVEPVPRLQAMARAFRTWSLAHPGEFGLMFGTPVPGVPEFEADCDDPGDQHPAARLGAIFLEPFGQLWAARPRPEPDPASLANAAPMVERKEQLPPGAAYQFLGAWTRLYGLVALEVFGHLRWALVDVEPLFEAELADLVRVLA